MIGKKRGGIKMETILYEKKEHIVTIRLNRPNVLNSFNSQMAKELLRALEMAEKDKEIYCVIITGEGEKAFSAGGDIKEESENNVFTAQQFSQKGHEIIKKLLKIRLPVIAAVNGYALGGGMELALACDIVIACQSAIFAVPAVNLGTISGWGGTQLLPQIVGKNRAKELLFTGRKINAQEAKEFGIVTKIVEQQYFMKEVFDFAKQIAQKPPFSIKNTKTAVNQSFDLENGLVLEQLLFSQCYATQDREEAMKAFLEKRKTEPFQNK